MENTAENARTGQTEPSNEKVSILQAPLIEAIGITELKELSENQENVTEESNVDAIKAVEEDCDITMDEKKEVPCIATLETISVDKEESVIENDKVLVMDIDTEVGENISKNIPKDTAGDNTEFDLNSDSNDKKHGNFDVEQTGKNILPEALQVDLSESILECVKDENKQIEKLEFTEKETDKQKIELALEIEESIMHPETSKNGSPMEFIQNLTKTIEKPNVPIETIQKDLEKKVESELTLEKKTTVIETLKPAEKTHGSVKESTAINEKTTVSIEDDIKVSKSLVPELESEENDAKTELNNKTESKEEFIEKELNSTTVLGKPTLCEENPNVIEIDDELHDPTKNDDEETEQTLQNKIENEEPNSEKELNSTTEVGKTTLCEENPNVIEINDELHDPTKNDDKETEQQLENKIENEEPNSDDDVQFEKPNIMVIEIDDDDDEDATPTTNINKNESTCQKTIESEAPLENITKKSEAMDVDAEAVPTTKDSIGKSTTEDVEMKETALSTEKIENLVQDADTNTLLVETTKPSSPSPENGEKLGTDDDTSGEVYYNKECVNYECGRKHKQFFRAPLFSLSYYKIAKKKFKPQFICAECYDQALEMYEEFTSLLAAKQPLLLKDIVGGRQEFVEIIDSSDEEDEVDKTDKSKDKYFSKNDIKLIENELDNSIRRVLERVEIQNQLTWSKTILASRAQALEKETNYIDAELRSLQKKADHMHVTLYQCPKIKVRQLQPLDLNTGRPYATADVEVALPPIGEIQRPPIKLNEIYYAVKNKAIASWVPCKVIEQVESPLIMKNIIHYKIRFLKSQYQPFKTVSVKHLAYFDPPNVRLPIGSRVIAYFDATSLSRGKEKMMIQSAFYPGIIAEPLKPNNKYRYLIFYDDGYTQYVYHKDVRLVCNVSDNVWEDVHPGSRDFIQKYLTQYSINRPMVQTQKGQSMTTESNGKWIYARVVDIDCSLIQMQFEGPKSHTEWIYRGSMRLGPVFKEHQKTMQKTTMPISRLPRRTEPFIRYTEDEEATSTQQQEQQERQLQQQQIEPRAVAKKSVSRQESQNTSQQFTPVPVVVRHLNNSTIYLEDENKPKGKVVYYTAKRNLPPQTYKPHTCSTACLYKITHNLSAYSPLSKPLLSGWERLIIRQKIKKVVTYRGPCGKILRNMKELRNYLRATNNVLNVENFDFSPETNCLAEYVIESAIVQKRDISNGQEKMAIPLVNYYDTTMPPECKYSAQRIPTEGVDLIVDEEFLVGCDCDDDCSDKTKCSCWQLTFAGAKYGNPNTPIEEIGYQYKRLYEHVPTGIYECNSRCKCKSNCLNRVVQHSLEMKLQVFKTSNRGWGLRCINDVPRGSFMCVYAGHLLTEAKANEGGLDAGDEYFAELDYIEVAEQIKEGYESDVDSPEPEEEDELYDHEDHDDEFTPSKPHNTRSKARLQKTTRGSSAHGTDEDSQERQMINFNPNAVMDENSMRESSIRKLFGKDEACYVMDAKVTGNLGRYFNHSCSPNLFVQNVFVDTHDLRFPWVAFFALTHIRAGTELTWNYNYEVGVVPGKVLYCQCGAPNCRLRLL